MCKCISDDKERIRNSFLEKENVEEVEDLTFQNLAFMFTKDNKIETQLYTLGSVQYTYKNKKGEIKRKKEKFNLAYNFCPMCGEKYKS